MGKSGEVRTLVAVKLAPHGEYIYVNKAACSASQVCGRSPHTPKLSLTLVDYESILEVIGTLEHAVFGLSLPLEYLGTLGSLRRPDDDLHHTRQALHRVFATFVENPSLDKYRTISSPWVFLLQQQCPGDYLCQFEDSGRKQYPG